MRHSIAVGTTILAAALLALTPGCSEPSPDYTQFDEARFALLLGNESGGHRTDGSAAGRVLLADEDGETLFQTPKFDPAEMATLIQQDSTLVFPAEGALYRLDTTGLTKTDQDWTTGTISGTTTLSGSPAFVATGGGDGEGFTSLLVSVEGEEASVGHYLAATASCGDETHVFSEASATPGLAWSTVSGWENPPEQQLVDSGWINGDLPCQGSRIWGIDVSAQGGDASLVSWDVDDSYRRTGLPLTMDGQRLGGQDWLDGTATPSRYWLDDDQLVWVDGIGEVYATSLADASTERLFSIDRAPDAETVLVEKQGNTAVAHYVVDGTASVTQYAIPGGEVLAAATITLPGPDDLGIASAVVLP